MLRSDKNKQLLTIGHAQVVEQTYNDRVSELQRLRSMWVSSKILDFIFTNQVFQDSSLLPAKSRLILVLGPSFELCSFGVSERQWVEAQVDNAKHQAMLATAKLQISTDQTDFHADLYSLRLIPHAIKSHDLYSS